MRQAKAPKPIYTVFLSPCLLWNRPIEEHLLSTGLDAHVKAVGIKKTTLRISWAGMSRPIVYNMINSEGTRKEVPSLGFTKIIFTDDGGFSGTSQMTWTYKWDGSSWK